MNGTEESEEWKEKDKNTTPELLDAIKKVRDELQIDLNFEGKQTTIESYFNRV